MYFIPQKKRAAEVEEEGEKREKGKEGEKREEGKEEEREGEDYCPDLYTW